MKNKNITRKNSVGVLRRKSRENYQTNLSLQSLQEVSSDNLIDIMNIFKFNKENTQTKIF
ncbi:hypothetical protein HZS_5408 [Henneguya salminicola]|nr:hypothetical protein HZS_5408 [Henneguya salminicola]